MIKSDVKAVFDSSSGRADQKIPGRSEAILFRRSKLVAAKRLIVTRLTKDTEFAHWIAVYDQGRCPRNMDLPERPLLTLYEVWTSSMHQITWPHQLHHIQGVLYLEMEGGRCRPSFQSKDTSLASSARKERKENGCCYSVLLKDLSGQCFDRVR